MYRDLVLIRSGNGKAMLGLDKKTGAVRWETHIQMPRGQSHGNYISPILMEIPVAEGGKRTVLVTQEPPVLDPLTGEILGRLEIKGIKDGNRFIYQRCARGSMVGRDGEIYTGWGYDGPASPTYGFKLSLAGGKLVVTKGPNACLNHQFGDSPMLYRPGSLFGNQSTLFDPTNGNWCWIGKSKAPYMLTTMCGDLMITAHRDGPRQRLDFVAYCGVSKLWAVQSQNSGLLMGGV